MSGFLDGNFSSPYLSENVVTYPLSDKPNNANTAAFALTYYQWANTFAPAALGSTDNNAPNAYLYEQGAPEKMGNLVKFTRNFSQIPVTWWDIEQVRYTYPGLDSGVGLGNYVVFGARYSITMAKIANVKHEYVLNANVPIANVTPVTIVTLRGEPTDRIGQGGPFDTVKTVPNVDPTVWVVSSDPQRWRGSIWEVITKTVSAPNTFT